MLESRDGNLFISAAKDRNITLKTLGNGYVNVNEINLLHVATAVNKKIMFSLKIWKLLGRFTLWNINFGSFLGAKRDAFDREMENRISGRGRIEFTTFDTNCGGSGRFREKNSYDERIWREHYATIRNFFYKSSKQSSRRFLKLNTTIIMIRLITYRLHQWWIWRYGCYIIEYV